MAQEQTNLADSCRLTDYQQVLQNENSIDPEKVESTAQDTSHHSPTVPNEESIADVPTTNPYQATVESDSEDHSEADLTDQSSVESLPHRDAGFETFSRRNPFDQSSGLNIPPLNLRFSLRNPLPQDEDAFAGPSNEHEGILRQCIVNTDSIRPNYEDIFIDRSTIRKLESVTSLALKRPDAFTHGILKGNKITGVILYGPPGTGKSLLARGLAKQSGFNMLAVSTAEIWQKCFGEDEKVIKALFSLSRKLHPCIVFIDEADAMLGARQSGEKKYFRSNINQFLMEWDGLMNDTRSPFVLLATNRPFDLDPAVLRRAPIHINLGIPTINERKGILTLLLKDENLSQNIDLQVLANWTSKYTGSDLKSLCVMAALECVNDQSENYEDRVLERKHFMMAMKTITATGMNRALMNQYRTFGTARRNVEDVRD